MYPGYSPADHEYGKAAFEYGLAVAEARRQGVDFNPSQDPNGPEYVIGQAKGDKKKVFSRMKTEQAGASGTGNQSGSDARKAEAAPNEGSKEGSKADPADGKGQAQAGSAQPGIGENPFFVIDTNPTPVNIEELSHGQHKRASAEPTDGKKSKKLKAKHTESDEATTVQLEDITEEVDARLKEKEEKRKRKEEKKRKRESEGSTGGAVDASNGVEESGKHPKKKAKTEEVKDGVDGEGNVDKKKKRHKSEGEDGAADGAKSKKKRRMTSAE